jgi:hypothetical protein
MTVRTFWTIFIKILGIWLILDSLTVVPQFISTLFYSYPYDTGVGLIFSLVILALTIGVYIFILRLFVYKTSWFIDKLHLDKGFTEEKIDLNVQRTTVLSVAVIVIGGLLFVDSLPQLCKQTFMFFRQQNLLGDSLQTGWIIFYLVKAILAYLLMTNSKAVVTFINRRSEDRYMN